MQPIARLYGRLTHGLTPWRKRGDASHMNFLFPYHSKMITHWSETWRSSEDWLLDIEKKMISLKTRVCRGGDFDQWDIKARTGLFTVARGLLAVEEHGSGKQFLKFKTTTKLSAAGLIAISILLITATLAAIDGAAPVTIIFACLALVVFLESMQGTAFVMNSFHKAVNSLEPGYKIIIEQPIEDVEKQKVDENEYATNGGVPLILINAIAQTKQVHTQHLQQENLS
jgi:ABC-type multidrug transport system fused ATPase/permease subunit